MAKLLKIPRRFRYEHQVFQSGLTQIAGVDEAGRGPLAGPVVAAAVILPTDWILGGMPKKLKKVNDSKQLSHEEREDLFAEISTRTEIRFAVAAIDEKMIDQINILQATHRAMNLALAQLNPFPQHALVDGLRVKTLSCPQTAIVDGDCLSYSIAAASIIAKVTRDRMMLKYHEMFPAYGFHEHKGYGTPLHLAAIKQHGPCAIHRMTFAPIRPVQTEFFAVIGAQASRLRVFESDGIENAGGTPALRCTVKLMQTAMNLIQKLKTIFSGKVLPEHLRRGALGEKAAKKYLQKRGLKFLCANFRSARGEMDLVFRERDCLVFIEVKTRSSEDWTRPAAAVNAHKRKLLSGCALDYLQLLKNPEVKIRFDIVEVLLKDGAVREIRHLPNTFNLSHPYRYG